MSGGLVQPTLRRPAGRQPASRARPQTAARTPARQPAEARSRSGGRPLPPSTRERMEAAFGPAGFQPGSEEGTRLLAHELARVVQQDSGDEGTAQARGPASGPSGPVEREADSAAEQVTRGEPADVVPGGAAWTTRARILRRARAGAAVAVATSPTAENAPAETAPAEAAPEAHDAAPAPLAAPSAAKPVESPPPPVEPGPELESEQTTVLAAALDAAKQQVATRATRASPRSGPPAAPATPRITPDPSPPRACRVTLTGYATGTEASARDVEAVARGPPVPVLSHSPIIQTKLTVSSPGDSLEREADAVAARVLRDEAPSPPAPGGSPPRRLQRALPPARGPPIIALSHAFPRTVASVVAAPGGGRPLDAAVRARIEPHLGIDLSHVRVRQGPDAAAAARDLHARAFVSGTTIFLAAGSSPTDLALMAHEATHVAQQQTVPAARTTLMRAVADFLPDVSVSDLIPGLDSVRSAVRAIPGYTLLTHIVGTDPLTGEPVAVSPEELIETLLTYGPFGTGVSAVLQSIDVLGQIVDVVSTSLAAHDLTLARVQRDIDAAWDALSISNGIAGNVAILQRYVAALLSDVAGFVESIAYRVLEIVRSVVAEITESLLETPQIAPVWNLAKKVMHYDPLRDVEVEAPTVEIIADFLRLIGEEERLAQMEERGTLQETADWLDTQLATFQSLIGELAALYAEAWAAIQPEKLPDLLTNLAALAQSAFGYVQHVVEFGATLILKILELVKQSLLGWLSEQAHSVPGFDLLTVILGLNPFTGELVERTAVTLIRGFITLIPGGAETYDQLAETGVIDQAAERIESEMVRLGISVELITGIFHGIWDTLTLDHLLDPIGVFTRILTQFGEPLLRLVEFVIVVIEVVVTLILRLMNFPLDLLESVITNAVQAIDDIAADPIGFLLHMMEAVKLGFTNYFSNIVGHLTQGLVDWLFRGLGQLGIQIPTDFSLGSILTLVFQVLGLTAEHLWEKLAEHERIGPERVAMIREGLDKLTGVWAFIVEVSHGELSAIWRFIADQLSGLWTTLLSMAMEWILTKIITVGLTKLLAFLDPTFVMAVVNGFIAFFNLVASAIEYFRDMLEILAGYVSTLAAVAAGNVVPGAQMIEQGLADALPIAIGFLAKQVGIGNIPDKIAEIIGSVRGVVDDALDWLIDQALRLGQAALNALGSGEQDPAAATAPGAVAIPEVAFEDHRMWFKQVDDHEILMIQSEPKSLTDFLDSLGTQTLSVRKKAALQAAQPIATSIQPIADLLLKAKPDDPSLDDKRKKLLDEENKLVPHLRVLLKRISLADFDEIYSLEGLTGPYSSMPTQKDDLMTPDHQPQAAVLIHAATKVMETTGGTKPLFKDRRLETAASGEHAKGGWTINIYHQRHTKGRTYGRSMERSTENALDAISGGTLAPDDRRTEVIKVLRTELEEDVKWMIAVADRKDDDPVWEDIRTRVSDETEAKPFIQKVREQIKAGEARMKVQDLEGYKS